MTYFAGNNGEMIFNANLTRWQKILLLFGWHIQVRVCGPMVQWGITRKPLTEVDADCLEPGELSKA